MSVSKVNKEISHFETLLRDERRPGRRAFVVTDSKGRYLSRCLERRDYLQFIWRGGARIGDDDLLGVLEEKIRDMQEPLVLIWLGTCDLTKLGQRKRVSLRRIEPTDLRNALDEMQKKILQINSSSKVIFLKCPVYSISKWNESHGLDLQERDGSDDQLETAVKNFNEVIDSLNNCYTPKFSLDLLKNTKTKHGRQSRYYFNFKDLYLDGIHPGPEVSKLWLLRIRKIFFDHF